MYGGDIMARGGKQVDGQLSFEMCLYGGNYVVQANSLIGGRQALKLNSAKLVRAAIMQVVKNDIELKPYVISINDLADLIGVSPSNIYRDIEDITNDIISNPVYIRKEIGTKISWLKIPWETRCEYQSDAGVAIKLNDELKPFLINLKEHYTQYTLDNILAMKSVYGIRIFEMLQERISEIMMPQDGVTIELSVQTIRECCDCEDKYKTFSNFKARVIDIAIKEINRVTVYHVTYRYIKKGRAVVGIAFHVIRNK